VVRRAERRSPRCEPAATAAESVLVADTSAVLEALVAREPTPGLIERLSDDADLHGPHLIDTELLHALRRMTVTGAISDERAADARTDFAELRLVRYPHQPLNDRVWELRENLTAYDATFVALAEALDAPLITCDARLASAPGHTAAVELFETA
jgi:predicted nucleic acid-binding protein